MIVLFLGIVLGGFFESLEVKLLFRELVIFNGIRFEFEYWLTLSKNMSLDTLFFQNKNKLTKQVYIVY